MRRQYPTALRRPLPQRGEVKFQIHFPIIFCGLILGVLSVTQTDVLARWGHHRHGRFGGDFSALENRERVEVLRRFRDHSKYHAVLNHSREEDDSSRFDVKKATVSPEMIMLNNGITRDVSIDNGQLTSISTRVLGIVNEDDVGAAHPESKTQKKQQPKSAAQCTGNGWDPSKGCG